MLSYDVPCNAGFYRPIEVIAPPGTIANGVLPAASAARGLTGFRMIDTCFGALAQMLPQRSIAASEGGNTGVSIGGYDAERKPFIFVEFLCSAWGGRAWSDGLDGNANLMANMSLPPVEITEAEQPLQILTTEFIQDVGGPGKYRGGASIRPRLQAARVRSRPPGPRGSPRLPPVRTLRRLSGRASQNVMNPGSEDRSLPGKFTMTMKRGDILRHDSAGPGGWGDPLERDPARVARDVRNEFVSRRSAREDYGVVFRGEGARSMRRRQRRFGLSSGETRMDVAAGRQSVRRALCEGGYPGGPYALLHPSRLMPSALCQPAQVPTISPSLRRRRHPA